LWNGPKKKRLDDGASKKTFIEGGRLPAGSKTSRVTLEANYNFLHLALDAGHFLPVRQWLLTW
jgi:hypothetical protein